MHRNLEDRDEALKAKELLLSERSKKEEARKVALLARLAHERQTFLRLGPTHEDIVVLKARLARLPIDEAHRAAVDMVGGLDAARAQDSTRDSAIAKLEQLNEARSHATRSSRDVRPEAGSQNPEPDPNPNLNRNPNFKTLPYT